MLKILKLLKFLNLSNVQNPKSEMEPPDNRVEIEAIG